MSSAVDLCSCPGPTEGTILEPDRAGNRVSSKQSTWAQPLRHPESEFLLKFCDLGTWLASSHPEAPFASNRKPALTAFIP